jgi:transcriptional regulator with XRE-family HTH domain
MPGKRNGRRKGSAGATGLAIDELVGRKIQSRRTALGILREDLAHTVGVGAAELESFELGAARAAPQVLAEIAKALDVSVAWFFVQSED